MGTAGRVFTNASFQEEIARLTSEVQLHRDLLLKAEKRAETAVVERDTVGG